MADDLKDEPEAERPSLDTILESWLEKYGEEKHNKAGVQYFAINSKDYTETLSSLLNSILYAGYTEEDVRGAVVLRKIHDTLTTDIASTNKLEKWKDIITKAWKYVLIKQFANKELIKPATNFKTGMEIKAQEKLDKEEAPEPYIPPKSKLDPDKFEGYGDAEVIYDENFAKLFEGLKDE